MDVGSVTAYEAPVVHVAPAPAAKPASAPAPAAKAPAANTQAAHTAHNAETEGAKSVVQTPLDEAAEKIDKQNGQIPLDHLEKAIDQINKSLVNFNREMEISMHSKLNRIMVKVKDTVENKVIREIPPEKALDAFAKALELAGVLVDEKR
jgi:flagellar protein FlaG